MIDYDAESMAKGDMALWTKKEYGDFVLQVDRRIKEAPFINKKDPSTSPTEPTPRDFATLAGAP